MKNEISLFIYKDIWDWILLSLPIKSIGRFRCVCKLWHQHLCSSYFIRTQCFAFCPSTPLFIVSTRSVFFSFNLSSILNGAQVYKTEAKFLERGRHGTLADTGLLCYSQTRNIRDPLNNYVCNPITQDYIVIPSHYSEPWGGHAPTNRYYIQSLLYVKGISYGIADDCKIIAFDMEKMEWEIEEHNGNNDEEEEDDNFYTVRLLEWGEALPNKDRKKVTTLTLCEVLADGYIDINIDHHYLFMTTSNISAYPTKYDYELYFYDLRSPDNRYLEDGLYTFSALHSFKPILCTPKVASS
ncbi:hypothetical protein AMTRI_Chr02g220970 [Amborella trichopoda]